MAPGTPLLIAGVDRPTSEETFATAGLLGDLCDGIKTERQSPLGWSPIRHWHRRGVAVMADLKSHRVPRKSAEDVADIAAAGARFVTVHTMGDNGLERLKKCRQALARTDCEVVALTKLTTSHAKPDRIVELVEVAHDAGVRRIVASVADLPHLASRDLFRDFLFFTPGVRPLSLAPVLGDDQARTANAVDAALCYAYAAIIERPIRDAANPVEATRLVREELAFGTRLRELVCALCEAGVVQVDTETGFSVANPSSPRTPVYFDLGTRDAAKPGPVTYELADAIAHALARLAVLLQVDAAAVAGVPSGGCVFARLAAAHLGPDMPVVDTHKYFENEGRRVAVVTEAPYPGYPVLLFEDAMNSGYMTAMTIETLHARGYRVVQVLSVLDRRRSDADRLPAGVPWASLFTPATLLMPPYMAGSVSPEELGLVLSHVGTGL